MNSSNRHIAAAHKALAKHPELGAEAESALVQPMHSSRALETVAVDPKVPSQSPWPAPLESQAYYGLLGEVVRAVAPETEADPAALVIQLLVAFGNLIGRGPYFIVEQQPHHTNLFALLVGDTSKSRKGTSLARVRALIAAVDPQWVENRIHGGAGSGEGIIWAVRDPILKGERFIDEGIADKRLLLLETEFAQILGILERQGATLSETLRRAWDGTPLQILVKNSPARATGAHISVLGHITKSELVRRLADTEVSNGFANRFIFVCVKRSKRLPDGGDLDWRNHPEIIEKLANAVRFARDVGEMNRDSGAHDLWHELYGELSEGKPGLFGSVISRAEAQVLRLSMLYALLDCSREIRREHLMAALAVWKYAENSSRYIFGDTLGDPVADEILRVLRANSGGLTRTEISEHFGRNRSQAQISGALSVLLEHGLADYKFEETGGRDAERWFACAGGTKKTKETN